MARQCVGAGILLLKPFFRNIVYIGGLFQGFYNPTFHLCKSKVYFGLYITHTLVYNKASYIYDMGGGFESQLSLELL